MTSRIRASRMTRARRRKRKRNPHRLLPMLPRPVIDLHPDLLREDQVIAVPILPALAVNDRMYLTVKPGRHHPVQELPSLRNVRPDPEVYHLRLDPDRGVLRHIVELDHRRIEMVEACPLLHGAAARHERYHHHYLHLDVELHRVIELEKVVPPIPTKPTNPTVHLTVSSEEQPPHRLNPVHPAAAAAEVVHSIIRPSENLPQLHRAARPTNPDPKRRNHRHPTLVPSQVKSRYKMSWLGSNPKQSQRCTCLCLSKHSNRN